MKVHGSSDVQSIHIGAGTVIWQFCVILPGAQIGEYCNICSHCFIENDVLIGDRVTIKNGVHVFDSIEIHDDVFIGPNVVFTNDPYPYSSRNFDKGTPSYPQTKICAGASIGGGATILPGVTIGEGAIIGAGAVVTKNVNPQTIMYGEGAKVKRIID